jgi:hypothetical protein
VGGETSPPAPVPFARPFRIPLIAIFAGGSAPVRLPAVQPGEYRIAKRVYVGSRPRWLFASLTIFA